MVQSGQVWIFSPSGLADDQQHRQQPLSVASKRSRAPHPPPEQRASAATATPAGEASTTSSASSSKKWRDLNREDRRADAGKTSRPTARLHNTPTNWQSTRPAWRSRVPQSSLPWQHSPIRVKKISQILAVTICCLEGLCNTKVTRIKGKKICKNVV